MPTAGAISLNWGRSGNASSDELRVVSDERLVAAAKIGHSGAFNNLYKRHAEKMFRITYRILRNREDAEDAVQECFLNRVLGVLAISQNAISNTEHLFGMTLIQIIEGTAVTDLRGCHKPLVAHHAEFVG